MSWFDFFKNMGNKITADKLAQMDAPPLLNESTKTPKENFTPWQYDTDGKVDTQATLRQMANTTPRKLSEHLFGRDLSLDTTTLPQGDNKNVTMATETLHQPGFFENLDSGMDENYNNSFKFANLAPDSKKRLGYRIGEGLGSIARGLSGTLGDAYIAGSQGLDAAMKRQGIRTGNELYRQDLINTMQNSLRNSKGFHELKQEVQDARLAEIANRVNNIPGYLTEQMYGNLINTQQIRDNADFRKMYYDNQAINNAQMMQFRKDQATAQQQQNAFDNNIKLQELGIKREQLENDSKNNGVTFNNITTMRKEFNSLPEIKNYKEIKRQYDNVQDVYSKYKQGKLKANAADQVMVTTLNKILDPTSVVRESEFARTAQGQSTIAKMEGYANKLVRGGSGLTNREREDLYNAMQAMLNATILSAKETTQTYTDLAQRYGINPQDIVTINFNDNDAGEVIQVGKYKVRRK